MTDSEDTTDTQPDLLGTDSASTDTAGTDLLSTDSLGYSDAMTEIESIITQLEQGNVDIDTLEERVKRATQLLQSCRSSLLRVETAVTQAVSQFDEEDSDQE